MNLNLIELHRDLEKKFLGLGCTEFKLNQFFYFEQLSMCKSSMGDKHS